MNEGVTFDDVMLVPQRSFISSRKDVDVSTNLTKNIKLNIPLVSSPMSTVTESRMAIELARLGGLGFIHRNMPILRQVGEVLKAKRAENTVIENPCTLHPTNSVEDVIKTMNEKNISGIPIVDNDNYLKGIITRRDIDFERNLERPLSELMTKSVVTAPIGTTLQEAERMFHINKVEKLPLIDKDGRLTGLITAKDIKIKRKYPSASKDRKGRLLVGASVGVVDDYLERAHALAGANVDVLIVFIAHGHLEKCIEAVRKLKKEVNVDLVVGNVVTSKATRDLIEAGADCINVGIGPGAACFEGSTPILMSDYTVKDIKDINAGDSVITHKGRARKVIRTYKRNYKGSILKLKIGGCPGELTVTPEHPILSTLFDADSKKMKKNGSLYYFNKKKYNKGLDWIEAKYLKLGDVVAIPKSKNIIKTPVFDIADLFQDCEYDEENVWSENRGQNINSESHVDLAQRFNTTPRVIGNIVNGGKSFDNQLNKQVNSYLNSIDYVRQLPFTKINRKITLNKDLMRLFGYYIAEGFRGGYKNNMHLGFAFSNKEHEYHQDVKNLVRNVFGYEKTSTFFRKDKHAATVQVSNKIIAKFFESVFPEKKAVEKKLPEFILNQPLESLREFLIGARRGDGSVKDYRRVCYNTVSRNLAFQIAEIFMKLGYMPSIKVDKKRKETWNKKLQVTISGTQYDRFVKEFPELTINKFNVSKTAQQSWEDDDYIYLSVDNVEVFETDMDVYNIEVEEDNSYVANRIAVHNCTTRLVAGVGVPQITAITNCYEEAKKFDIPIIADGGIRRPGDFTKALAAGASLAMCGQLFAGTEESPGKSIVRNGQKYKAYYGMASATALEYYGEEAKKKVPEGVEATVSVKGTVEEIVHYFIGGLRSGMSYSNARTLKELRENAEFIKCTQAGLAESHPHDIVI